ncbi:MFS transporter [Streptomyces zaomyceticus]|uniref:MFS transporter n=1 Tax=Streptomyces zaomyceticus TaxID=68286 RepID=UPI00227D76F4|nr:MFS transporter [Streptomyces zaomyceticus]
MLESATPTAAQSATAPGQRPHRNFRLLLIGETTSKLGTSVTSVLLPLVAVTTLHASPFMMGVLTAAPWLPWLVVGLPAGAWVDRLAPRPLMLVCNAVSATVLASVPVTWWLGTLTMAHLLGAALASGTAAVFFSTAYSAYLPRLVATDDLMTRNAQLQAGDQAARVAGPGLGGLTAQTLGGVPGLLLDAASFLVSSICLTAIRPEGPRPAPAPRRRLSREMADGLRFVVGDPWVRAVTAFGAAVNLAMAGFQAVQIVFLVRTVGVGSDTLGWLVSCGGLGGVLGGLVAGRLARGLGTARALLVIQFTASPFGLLAALAGPGPRLAFFVLGTSVMLAGVVACNVILVSFRQTYCPAELLGRVTATTLFLNFSTVPLGALLGGSLASLLGARTTMWVVTAALLAAGGFLLVGPLRGLRDLPGAPAAED